MNSGPKCSVAGRSDLSRAAVFRQTAVRPHHRSTGPPIIVSSGLLSTLVMAAAWVERSVVSLRLSVCLFVCLLKGKRLELSTPKSAELQLMASCRQALTLRSRGQVLELEMGERRGSACRYDCIGAYVSTPKSDISKKSSISSKTYVNVIHVTVYYN